MTRAGAPDWAAARTGWTPSGRSCMPPGLEVVLSSDDHNYERFAPQDPQG